MEGLTSSVCNEDIIMHHIPESPGVSLGSRLSKEGSILERALLLVSGGDFVEHIYKLFFQVLS